MPKFVPSILLLSLTAWMVFIGYLTKVPPETNVIIFFGVFLFSIVFTLTTSLIIFILRFRKTPKFHREEPKSMFRTIFRKTAYLAIIISLALLVKMLI